MTHNGHQTKAGHSLHIQPFITGTAAYFFLSLTLSNALILMGTIISMALMQTKCLTCLEVAMLVQKAAQRHTAPGALEEVAQNPVLQFREPRVPSPPGALPFLLARWLCETLGQSLVKRNWLNCLVASKGDFAFFQIIDPQLRLL